MPQRSSPLQRSDCKDKAGLNHQADLKVRLYERKTGLKTRLHVL